MAGLALALAACGGSGAAPPASSAPPSSPAGSVSAATKPSASASLAAQASASASLAAKPSAATGAAVSAAPSGGAAPQASASAADMAFFNGKTITLIAPDNPGGSFDVWSRLLAPLMGQYLHATVNVQNIPPGNTIVGQNQLASSTADGLTIGWLNIGEDITNQTKGVPGVTFDPTKTAFVGVAGQGDFVLVADPASSYKSFDDIVKAAAPVPTLDVTSGTADLALRLIYGAYGVKAKYITGYESSKLLAAGFLRHDAPVAFQEPVVFQSAIQAGQALPLLILSALDPSNPIAGKMASVPTLDKLEQSNPPSSATAKATLDELKTIVNDGQVLAAPPGTPAGRVAALTAAMQSAMTQSSLLDQARKQGLLPNFQSGPQVRPDLEAGFKQEELLKPYLT